MEQSSDGIIGGEGLANKHAFRTRRKGLHKKEARLDKLNRYRLRIWIVIVLKCPGKEYINE
jgi:hypothetical protein